MKHMFIRIVFISVLMIAALPAWASPGMQAIQIFVCEMEDDATAEQIMQASSTWLKAAKTVPGGSNMKLYIRFPIAAEMGEADFRFVVVFPTFADWGAWTDAYENSAADKADEEFHKFAECNDSAIWEGLEVK